MAELDDLRGDPERTHEAIIELMAMYQRHLDGARAEMRKYHKYHLQDIEKMDECREMCVHLPGCPVAVQP